MPENTTLEEKTLKEELRNVLDSHGSLLSRGEWERARRVEFLRRLDEVYESEHIKAPSHHAPVLYRCEMGCTHPIDATVAEIEDQHALDAVEDALVLNDAEKALRVIQVEEAEPVNVVVTLTTFAKLVLGQSVPLSSSLSTSVVLVPDANLCLLQDELQRAFNEKKEKEYWASSKPFPSGPELAELLKPLSVPHIPYAKKRATVIKEKRRRARELEKAVLAEKFVTEWYSRVSVFQVSTSVNRLTTLVVSNTEFRRLFKLGKTKKLKLIKQKVTDFIESNKYLFETLGYVVTTDQRIPDEPPPINGVRQKQMPELVGWKLRKSYEL